MNQWLEWAKQLQAISQIGKTYSKDPYDLERFDQIAEIAYGMFADLGAVPVEKVADLFLPESGYATPKIDLRGGVIRENEILLVLERADQRWTLPGGWADVNETPSEGVMREVFEESGLVVANPRLVAIKDRSVHPYRPTYPFHIYKMFFLCDYVSGEAQPNLEVSDVGFFALESLPPLSESRIMGEDLEMLFRYNENRDLPVYVD